MGNEGMDTLAAAERRRVREIIARDRASRTREQMRDQAEREVRNGNFGHIADTVVEPTPEWLEQGDYQAFTPKLPDGHVRSVKTVRSVRRVVTPIVLRMWRADKITDDQARACLWLREIHDKAGLEGRWATSQLDGMNRPAMPRRNGGIAGHIPITLQEAEYRRNYRAALAAIAPRFVRMLVAVVIEDVPLTRAARFARCANNRTNQSFRVAVNQLVRFCVDNQIDVGSDAIGVER